MTKLYDHDDQWDAASSAFSHLASHRHGGEYQLVRNKMGPLILALTTKTTHI